VVIGADFGVLLSAAQGGDEAAFARLWRDAHPALLRYLRVVSGGDPEDVASDTWATVAARLRRFRGDEADWRAWLFATARRRAIDDGRRRTRLRVVPVREVPDLDWPGVVGPADPPDPADLVVANWSVATAIAAVRRLPPLQAEVVMLRSVAGLSVEEVARLLGVSPGAVRVAAHRGLKKLATEFSRKGVTR
jgi:RNA polymerase sigma-70 factor (ECF subfamily)